MTDKQDTTEPRAIPISRKEFKDLLDRLGTLEARLAERLEMERKHQQVQELLRSTEHELAMRVFEVERLKNELVQQKRVWEKELEGQRRLLEEKVALIKQESSEKLLLAQQYFDKQLHLEQQTYNERSGRERDRFRQKLGDYERQESLWTRLIRMVTWS
jgi:hypothetical protein